MRDDLSLSECISGLIRIRRTHPKPDLVNTLIERCRRLRDNPRIAPNILWTIERLERR